MGQVTLLYFWDTASREFENDLLPLFKQVQNASKDEIQFIGVSLDMDESAVRQAVKTYAIPGLQIFFEEEHQRSWNSPLVRFWGLSKSPGVWLVDRRGIVTAVDVTASRLVQKLTSIMK